jgi:hypothetical protein
MPALEEALTTALKGFVAGRVHPLQRPQADEREASVGEELPAIVYTPVFDQAVHTICETGTLRNVNLQLDCYHVTYKQARALAGQVDTAMAANFQCVRNNSVPFPDDDEKVYRWLLEYSVWTRLDPFNRP